MKDHTDASTVNLIDAANGWKKEYHRDEPATQPFDLLAGQLIQAYQSCAELLPVNLAVIFRPPV